MPQVQQTVTFPNGEVISIQYDSENPLSKEELIARAEEKRKLQKSFSPTQPTPEPEPEPQRENFVADMGQTMVRTMMGPVELGQDIINYAAKHPFGKAGELASGLFNIPEGFTTTDVISDDLVQNIKNRLVKETTRGLRAYGQDVQEEEIIDKPSGKYKDYSTTAGALTLAVPYIVAGGALMRSKQAFKEGTSRLSQTISNITSGGTAAVITENALYSDNPSETLAGVTLALDEEGRIQMNQQTKDFVEFFHIKEDDNELEKRMRLSLEALVANYTIGTFIEGIKLVGKTGNAFVIKPLKERLRPDMTVKEQADEAMALLKEAREELDLAELKPTDYIPLSETPQGLAQVEMQNSSVINRFIGQFFTSRGYFTPIGFNLFRQKEYATRQIIQESENIATRLSNKLDVLGDKRPTNKEVKRYLTENFDFDPNAERQFKVNKVSNRLKVDAETAEVVLDARELIDGLSSRIVNSSIPDGTLKEVIVENAGKYLRRSYRMFEDPRYKPSQSSINRFMRQIQDGFMKPLYITDPKTGETVLSREAFSEEEAFIRANSAVKSLMQDIKESRGDVFSFFHNMSSENKSLLLQRQKLSKVTREFLGEIENPSENIILTATKMARLVENNRFNERLLQAAGGKYLFPAEIKDAAGNVISGGKRVIFSQRTGKEISYTEKLNIPGSVLDGMYTTKQVKQALEGLQDDWFAGSLTAPNIAYKVFGQIFKGFSGLKGASQASKTVYSVTTTMRNLMGAPQFALANGVFSLGFKGGVTSFKSIANEAIGMGDKALDELYEHYLKLGIINTNVKIGEFRRSLKDFEQTASLSEFMGRQAERTILKAPQDFYMGIDDFFKIGVYNSELETLMKAFPDEPVEVLERKAAQLVRNNMPNYDLVPPNIKNLRYLPFGNFPAFPSEIIRTSVNIVKQGYEEINSGNAVLERRGIKRLLGFAAVPALWEGLSTASEYLMGYNDEEAQAAQKLSETPWSKSNKIFMVVDGQTVAIDTKFIDSYNTIREPVQAVLGEIINGEMKEKDLDEILMNAGVSAIKPLIAPYTDESIAAGALHDIANTVFERWLSEEEGRYVTDKGVEMTSPSMTNGEVLGEMAINLLDSVTPGVITSVQNIFSDEKKTNFDRPRKDKNLELIALSGIRMTPVYADEAVFYAAEKYKRQSDALGRKMPSFKDEEKEEEYLDRYARQLALNYQYQQDLYEVVSSARSSIGDVAVEAMLIKANIGDDMRVALFKNRAYLPDFISKNYREIGHKLRLDDQEKYADFMDRMNGIEDGILRTPLIRVDEKKISPRGGPLDLPQLEELQGFAKGGEVKDVPQVPVEPDERIDKMTGLPYNQQAGAAFMDEEDPERRLELSAGSIVAKLIAKNMPKTKPVVQRAKGEPVPDATLSPYAEVPEPATYDEMFNALDKNKKEKINLEIPDGQKVGLRLDIPAYTNHDTWVPTVHVKGKASHRATAAIENVDLMPTKGEQSKAEKVMRGGAKSPFARIDGNLINRSDEENYRLAQEALNDPEWTQVGYNPDRHSYFFDRATGDPIIAGDEAIQVGPLVLVKNAVRGERKDFMYSAGGLTRRLAKAKGGKIDKKSMACNSPRRTPSHPKKSHVVKACEGGKEKIIRFGEQGAKTAGKPKAGESERMKAKRKSFKARHRRNIKRGKMSAAYWADKVKW